MRNTCCHGLVTFFVLLFLCSVANSAEDSSDYIVSAGSEQLHFLAQPELGYVIKMREEIELMDSTSRFLKSTRDVKISPICGLGRKGTYVIYNEQPAVENRRVIKSLGVQSEVQYTTPLFSSNGEMVAIIPEIVVRVKPSTEIDQVQAICETAGCSIIKRMEFTEQEYLLEVLGPNAEAVFVAVEKLNQAPDVEWACPNIASQPNLRSQSGSNSDTSNRQLEADGSGQDANSPGVFPNDEYFPMQWHLHNTGQSGGTPGADIRALEAWEITTGDPNIVIAVIGIGVDTHHPDLVNNLVPGYDFWQLDDLPDPSKNERLDAHETLCAGIVAAEGNNKIGIAGVAYKCKIMPIRNHSMTSWITRDEDAMALRWAAAHGADIISCSWGRSNAPVIHSAVQDVTKIGGMGREGKGCIVLFAVGIDGAKIPSGWTETYPEVIAVGATDHNDMRWHYSGYGPELDLMAPSGCDGEWCGSFAMLWSTDLTGIQGNNVFNDDPNVLDYAQYWGGTSASCPIAAGVAALVLSVDYSLTNLDVQRILYHSACDLGEPGWDEYYGWGRVDARAAVEMALNPQPLYVDDDAANDLGPGDPNISDPNENGSAEHPFDSIQKAIDYALDTEKIEVLPGIYTGEGNRDIDFNGKILTIRSESGPAMCVIDCQGIGRCFNFHSGEGRDSLLEGFTIINGKGDSGGAISFMNKSSPTIKNCIFSNNIATAVGGAVNNAEGAAALINCTFYANKDLLGGGAISNFSNGMVITNCILRNNEPGEIYSFGTMDVTYSNISGGFAGEGNIDADPLFADVGNGDYHLKSQTGRWDPNSGSWVVDDVTSPCIDMGDPNSPVSLEPEPNGGRINMGAYGGTQEASMSLDRGGISLPNIAYIYHDEVESAEDYQTLLTSYGCSTVLIPSHEVATAEFDAYDLIIVGTDTGYLTTWENEQNVTAVEGSGKPVVGLGNGGYWYFGQLELSIGRPYGGYGSKNRIEVIDPNCSLFSTPHSVEIPQDRVLQLYTETVSIGIYLWPEMPETVTVLATEVNDPGYFPLIMEHERYMFWGFTESPLKMTEVGKTLFINVVIWMAKKAWESKF